MMNIKCATEQFVEEVKRVLGKSFQKAILYGSYARGDYQNNSDVDIMILRMNIF